MASMIFIKMSVKRCNIFKVLAIFKPLNAPFIYKNGSVLPHAYAAKHKNHRDKEEARGSYSISKERLIYCSMLKGKDLKPCGHRIPKWLNVVWVN
jgi:hypothetical protein